VTIDPDTLQLATPNCPTTRQEVYVTGSAPTQMCEIHGGHNLLTSTGSVLSHIFGGSSGATQTNPGGTPVTKYDPNRPPGATGQGQPGEANAQGEKKKSPLGKVFGIFGGKKKEPDKAKAKPEKGDSP
jgi:hypothetical protein